MSRENFRLPGSGTQFCLSPDNLAPSGQAQETKGNPLPSFGDGKHKCEHLPFKGVQ